MQRQAEEILLRGDILDTLAKLLLQSRDEVSVVGILTLLLHHRAVHQETERRLARLRLGQEWVALLQEPEMKTAQQRMTRLANAPRVYGKPLWKWYRLPKDFPGTPATRDGRQERTDVAIEALTALYDRVGRGVSPLTIGRVPGPLAGHGKRVPRWDAVALQVQQEDIEALQRTFLPAFEMEKGRLQILDALKSRHKEATAQKRTGEAVGIEEKTIEPKQAPRHAEAVATKGLLVGPVLEYMRQNLTPKMIRALELLAEDETMTDVDAAKKADVTPQGIRKAQKRLREKFLKDPSSA
jgi:hypothetical protein